MGLEAAIESAIATSGEGYVTLGMNGSADVALGYNYNGNPDSVDVTTPASPT